MGRPSKLTPECQARIVQAIEVGATYELAAGYGGISYETFRRWMDAGEKAKSGIFRAFFEAIKSAESKAAIKWLALIDKAAADTWQAAAWKLERRYPQDYGRTVVQNEITGRDGGAVRAEVKLDLSGMDAEQLRTLAQALED